MSRLKSILENLEEEEVYIYMYKSVLESGAAPLSSLAGPPRKTWALGANL